MKRGAWLLLGVLLTIGMATAMAVDMTVGVVTSGNIGYDQEMHKAFVATLAAEGFYYRKVDMLIQMPSPDPLSWTNAARQTFCSRGECAGDLRSVCHAGGDQRDQTHPDHIRRCLRSERSGRLGQNVAGIISQAPITSLLTYV